jgi:hypothetical protein
MTPIFTIPFPEYDIAIILQEKFPKEHHFSVAIPVSRQQKFYDLLVVNGKSGKSVTIQVKSSRVYYNSKKEDYQYYSWHKCFDVRDNYSDFYFFYITYPLVDRKFRPCAKWDTKILVFTKKEMVELLQNLKTEKGKKMRHFFEFRISPTDDKVRGGLGFHYKGDFTRNLLENRLVMITKKLN